MKNAFFIRRLTMIILVCLSIAHFTRAQSATATLSGTVTDERGAVVAGATVTVTNPATNLKRTATTNEAGSFFVAQLPPATYTVRVESQGFSATELKDLELNVNDQRTINIELKVGAVGATVQVDSEPSLIDESPAVATTVNRQFVENLPLNGRSFQSLFELTPGVNLVPSGDGGPGQFSVNGQRTNANYLTIDGVGANVGAFIGNNLSQAATGSVAGFSANGGTNNLVSVDALQEFTIQTSTYAPEFGRTPGAQISIVTRSGSNRFTGSVFEYLRNEALDANDWFANRNGFKRAPLRLHNFGGVLGGRIVKDKTFFFFSYEGLRLQQPQQQTFFVPSDALRAAAAPALRPILNAFPKANGALDTFNGQPTGYAAYNAVYSDKIQLDATSFRIDHNFTSKINLFGRFNYSPSRTTDRFLNPSTPATTRIKTHGLTIGSSQTFSSKLVNDLRFNYTKYQATFDLVLDEQGGATPFDASVLAPSGANFRNPTFGFFLVELTPTATGFRFAPGLFIGQLYNNRNRQFNIVDNLSYQAGSHALKFGFDYRRLQPTFGESDYFATYSAFTFASLTSNLFGGPNNLVSGNVNQLQITADEGERNPVFHNYSLYAQDTWKVTNRLTLTYGLRYEVNPAPKEKDGKNPLVLTNVNNPASIAVAPSGTSLYRTTYNNFAPRVGIAYQLGQKAGWETVVRGGFGVFYDLGGGSAAGGAFSQVFPFIARKSLFDFVGVPFPMTAAQTAPPAITSNLPATTEIYAFDEDIVLPRTYQWNFTVEQSIGSNQTVSAAYVAARGRELLRQDFIGVASATNPNGVNANFPSGVVVTRNTAVSDYDALQLQFTRRLTRGFQALASYTLAKSEDTASSDISRSAALFIVSPDADRGPSDFDVRHNFTAAVTYNIPAPFKSTKFAKAIFGGWSTDAIFRYRSALPVNVVVNNLTLSGVMNVTRPNVVAGQQFYIDDQNAPGGRRINPAAFVNPPAGTRGNLPRNALRGFSAKQVDFTLRRDFKIRERMGIQFRTEFFNIFNIPNFGNPENRFGNPNFGRATQMLGRSLTNANAGGAGLNSVFQVGGPRSIQFSLRFYF